MSQEQNSGKEQILKVAKRLFAAQGYDGTSIRQICDQAGVNIALVSYYFGGKEKLFFAMVDEYFCKLEELEHEDFGDPVRGISRLIRTVMRGQTEDPELATIIDHELRMETSRSTYLRQYTSKVWAKLGELLVEGKKRGLFHFESTDYMVLMVMGTLLFPRRAMKNLDRTLDINLTEEETIRFVFRGLGYQQLN